jgi:uncharacterized protein YkwD
MMSRLPSLATAAVALCLAAAAAPAFAGTKNAGTFAKEVFTPAYPGATSFGPDESRKCPRGGPMSALADTIDDQWKSDAPKPIPDGRLCAFADTLIDWDPKVNVPLDLTSYLSRYFGLPTNPRLVITVTDTDRSRDLGERLAQPTIEFARKATAPRYGLATLRISAKAAARGDAGQAQTKLVLVLWDHVMDLDQPLPRKLTAGQTVSFSGKLLGDLRNPKVDIGNVDGKLESPAQAAGAAFKADLHCGDRAGELHVELRAEANGAPHLVTNLALSCGVDPAPSLTLSSPFSGELDAAAEEKKIFDLINADRTALGIVPLEYDPGVAKVARQMAENTRDDLKRGVAPGQVDVIKLLKDNDIISSVITANPARAVSPADAHKLLLASPFGRSQYLSTAVTHAGMGLALVTDANGQSSVILDELFVKEQPPHDLAKVREQLKAAVLQKRADARANPLESDPELEAAAQAFADALAASRNDLPKEKDDAIIHPLYKSMGNLQIITGAPKELTDFSEQPNVIANGKLMGLAVAEGVHPVMGKGTVYVVLLIGAHHEAAATTKGKGKQKKK